MGKMRRLGDDRRLEHWGNVFHWLTPAKEGRGPVMCGIVGAFDLTGNRDFPAEWLRAMTVAIAHRGPDDEYFHREPGLAPGTRRLAIVDLAGGRQPLANEDETVWVSFNGELFDYPELRQQFQVRGHHLATRCDTELWVHL